MLNVKITSREHRDRLRADLDRLRAHIAELIAQPPNPKASRARHYAASLRAAKADARDLARGIRNWDDADRAAAKAARGKRRGVSRSQPERQGDHRVEELRAGRGRTPPTARQLARANRRRTKADTRKAADSATVTVTAADLADLGKETPA